MVTALFIVGFSLACGLIAAGVTLIRAARENRPHPRHRKEKPVTTTIPRWLRWLVSEDPDPQPSRLDVLDGVTEKEGER